MNKAVYNPHTEEMKEWARAFGPKVARVADSVLNNSDFAIWSGSVENKHHCGKCGLSQHTYEVISIANSVKKALNLTDVLDVEIFLSGLFHDIGKLWDYAPVEGSNYEEWVSTPHKRIIHHISRSALYWQSACEMEPDVWFPHFENVLHVILSHHGRRDYGSPVSPFSKLAWLMHYSDALSARINDCNRIDLRD